MKKDGNTPQSHDVLFARIAGQSMRGGWIASASDETPAQWLSLALERRLCEPASA
jgi:hypothetical protein